MGIDVAAVDFLMFHKEHFYGNLLQLGRQGLHFVRDRKELAMAKQVFEKYDTETDFNTVISSYPHADSLFTYLGASNVESLDNSDFEQASMIHDLNDPVPEEWHNKFDHIYDGGTIEHIFDIKTVFENIKKMLKVGGVFSGLAVCNNAVGHGFYQFSPDLYRTVFSEDVGYKVIAIQLIDNPQSLPDGSPSGQFPVIYDLETPKKGDRQDIPLHGSMSNFYVAFIIKKVAEVEVTKNFQQGDYLRNWEEFEKYKQVRPIKG